MKRVSIFFLAARLFGSGEKLFESVHRSLEALDLREYQQDIAALHETMTGEEFLQSWAEGRSMTPEEPVWKARSFAEELIC